MRIQSTQSGSLVTWFADITEKDKSHVQIVTKCYEDTTVNLASSSLGFFSRQCSLKNLEVLSIKQHLITAVSVKFWPGVMQMNQTDMALPVSEGYNLLVNAKSLDGSVLARYCGSAY